MRLHIPYFGKQRYYLKRGQNAIDIYLLTPCFETIFFLKDLLDPGQILTYVPVNLRQGHRKFDNILKLLQLTMT